jgi:hypothetical protein
MTTTRSNAAILESLTAIYNSLDTCAIQGIEALFEIANRLGVTSSELYAHLDQLDEKHESAAAATEYTCLMCETDVPDHTVSQCTRTIQ